MRVTVLLVVIVSAAVRSEGGTALGERLGEVSVVPLQTQLGDGDCRPVWGEPADGAL
jgi:hypothetical protein